MMITKWTTPLAMALAAVAMSAPAFGDSVGTVQVQLAGAPGWGVGAPGGYAPMAGYPTQNIGTGLSRLQVNTSGGYSGTGGQAIANYAKGTGGTIDSFSAEAWQAAPTGYQTYQIMNLGDDAAIFGPISSAARAQKVGDLYKLFANFMPGSKYNQFSKVNIASNEGWTNNSAAAFQACVWEIINESPGTSYSVSGGTFWDGGAWAGTANTWLSKLAALPSVNQPDLNLFVLANPGTQDYAAVGMGVGFSDSGSGASGPTVVPEPLTMLGVMTGIGGLAGYVRWRRLTRVQEN